VSKDYYAQEIAFQDKIISINNERSLNGSIYHEIKGKEIPLKYKLKTFCENKKTISITKK
jgi:hypothetical protein